MQGKSAGTNGPGSPKFIIKTAQSMVSRYITGVHS